MTFIYLQHLIISTILLQFCQMSNGQCGFADLATSTIQNLTSPDWPQNYGGNLDCAWNITSNPGTRIEINFLVFNTEDPFDVLNVNSRADSLRLTGLPCLPTYISQTSSVQLTFQTDGSGSRKGFFASYKQVSFSIQPSISPSPATCGSRIDAVSEPQLLTSPGWPGVYLDNLDCSWTISASAGRQINITFLQFATENCCDILEIYEGTSSTSPEKTFQGFLCPQFLSRSDTVRLRFVTDGSTAEGGFQILFQETPAEPTTVETTTMQTEPTTVETTTMQTEPTTVETTTMQTEPTTVETTTMQTEPTTVETTTMQTEPTTVETTTMQTEPTTVETTTMQTEPTTVETTTMQTEPTTVETTTMQTEPTTVKTTTMQTEPTTVETTTMQTEPTTVETTTMQTEPTTVKTTTMQTEPTTVETTAMPTEPTTTSIETTPMQTHPTTTTIETTAMQTKSMATTMQVTSPLLSQSTTTQTLPVDPFCSTQTLSGSNGSYLFDNAPVYSLASSTQLCNSTNKPLAAVRCLPGTSNDQFYTGGTFDVSSLQEISCGISLNDLRNTSHQDLSTIEVLTSQPDLLSIEEVETATEILMSFQEEDNVQVTESTLTSVVNTVSNLAAGSDIVATDSDSATATKSTLLSTLNNFASSIIIPENSTKVVNVRSANINVQAVRIAPLTADGNNNSAINYPNLTFSLNLGTSNMSTLVTIPSLSIAEIARNSSSNAPVFHATVFGGSLSLDSSQNTSQVVSISTTGYDFQRVSVFINFEDVEIPSPTTETENPLKRMLNKAEVSSWNFDNFRWNFADRCQQDNPSRPAYQCQGFASYAVLFTSKEVPSILALTAVSYVGSILSIIFLSATIFIHLKYREIRKRPTTMTLVNICICLTAVYFFYIVGVGRAQYKPTCDAMTFILHYFTLTSMVWMTVNAVEMYKAFTQLSYAANNSKPAIYFSTYGLPFLLVVINFSVTVLYFDKFNNPEDIFLESLYRYKHVCWLQSPSLIWGFVLPLGLMLLLNYGIFILLLRKVLFRKQKIRSTAKSAALLERLVNAVTMVTVMGLSWIFGYFLLISDDVTYQSIMQWLFTLTNTFQGLIIFYLYCVRRESIRKLWLPQKIGFRNMFSSSVVENETSSTAVTFHKRQNPKKSASTLL